MIFSSRRSMLKSVGAAAALCVVNKHAYAADGRADITVGMQDLRYELDPLHPRATALSSFRVLESVYDKLFAIDYDNGGALRPMLGERLERVADHTYRLTLRRGVLFHDGSEMTAEDVAFTFGDDRMLAKTAPGYSVGQITFPTLASSRVVERYVVEFKTSSDDPVFEKRFTSYGGGIVSKSAYLAAKDFNTWVRAPIAAGPYRVEEIKENGHIILKSHDAYWGGQPPLRSLRFQLVPEASVRAAGLLAGDFDIVTTISPDQIKSVTSDRRFDVVGGDTMSFRTLVYDCLSNPVLRDARIRRAMNLAIDRQGIVDSLWHGRITVPRSHQQPAYGDLYNANRTQPTYDPVKAKKLLSETGYKGEEIVFKSIGNYYTAELAETQIISEMWKAIGLNIKIEIKENWAQVQDEHPRAVNNSSDGTYYPDPVASFVTRWGSASAFQSRGYWKNERFNELERELLTSLDPVARRTAYQGMLDIFDDIDPPGTVIHSLGEFFGRRADIKWMPTSTGLMDFRPDQISI